MHEYAGEKPGSLLERDQIYLQTFGFCYDDDLNRAVAVSLRYLLNLRSEHQQMWKAKELSGHYVLHPDYDRQKRGVWPDHVSIFDAFIAELILINQMSALMDRPQFFRETFEVDRPREFTFPIRTTSTEFNNFVHILDKMLSENINREFFRGEVEVEDEVKRSDGKIEVRNRGSISLLEEWLENWQVDDPKPLEESITTLREVRRKRQRPAHAVDPNEFDQEYFHEQRKLIIRAYNAVRTLRLLFANDPAVISADLKVSDDLFEGRIRTF